MSNHDLTAYVAAFVDELAILGITDIVVSPGSRSTPMAMLMAEHKDINIYINIDERSAAFFALGLAKGMNKPVAILCTSGTAAANYMPAVVEAFYARVPLLILTADRPHELRDVGAPQSIDQIELFGKNVKWFNEMAIPEATDEMLRYVRTVAGRAVGIAQNSPSAPVHLNFPFREPLVPDLNLENLWKKGNIRSGKHVEVTLGKPMPNVQTIEEIGSIIRSSKKGIIICGDIDNSLLANAITKLSAKINYPILADPLSQLRSGSHDKTNIVECYDTILRSSEAVANLKPEVILRFGSMPVSKSLLLYIKEHSNCQQIIVDSGGGWREPTLSANYMLHSDEEILCNTLSEYLPRIDSFSEWLDQWQKLNKQTREMLELNLAEEDIFFEGKVLHETTKIIPSNSQVFVGNSMPIRDLDSFYFTNDKALSVFANRGANGIDGIISTALGISVNTKKTVLIVGDLSFYHDLNGLLAAKLHELNLTIVLINNDGGGIFSFLPQSNEKKNFEKLFGTPIGLDYKHVVEMYNGKYIKIESVDHFRSELLQSVNNRGLQVLEVQTNREENVSKHRSLWKNVSQEIAALF